MLGFGVDVLDLDFGVQINSIEKPRATLWVLETCLIVRLLPFIIILITASLSSKIYSKASLREDCTFEDVNKHCLNHQSFHDFSFALEIYTGLPTLDYSDACFREQVRRSDPKNQTREFRPISIQRPKRWFPILLNCVNLKFVSYTSIKLDNHTTSRNAQWSTWCRFWILKISWKICKRGVIGQRARLLNGRSAQGFSSELIHIKDEMENEEDEIQDWWDKWRVQQRGSKWEQTHKRMTLGWYDAH